MPRRSAQGAGMGEMSQGWGLSIPRRVTIRAGIVMRKAVASLQLGHHS